MSVGAVNKNTGDRIPTAGNPLDKVGNLASLHTTAKNDAVSAINEVKDEVSAIKDGTAIDSFADVENALADKTEDDAVAPEFDNTVAYSAGNLVYHDGTLYKFDSDHAAGAWDASEVSPTTVAAEFNQLKNTLSDAYKVASSGTLTLGALSANASGYKAISFNIPSGYVSTGIYSVKKSHPGDSTSLQISATYSAGYTGTITVYVSYSTVAAVLAGSDDYVVTILCKKV